MAAYNLGCFAGSIPTIWVGNYLGRRKTIFLGSAIMVVGAILQTTAYHLTQLIIGRIITGFGKLYRPLLEYLTTSILTLRKGTESTPRRFQHGNLSVRNLIEEANWL